MCGLRARLRQQEFCCRGNRCVPTRLIAVHAFVSNVCGCQCSHGRLDPLFVFCPCLVCQWRVGVGGVPGRVLEGGRGAGVRSGWGVCRGWRAVRSSVCVRRTGLVRACVGTSGPRLFGGLLLLLLLSARGPGTLAAVALLLHLGRVRLATLCQRLGAAARVGSRCARQPPLCRGLLPHDVAAWVAGHRAVRPRRRNACFVHRCREWSVEASLPHLVVLALDGQPCHLVHGVLCMARVRHEHGVGHKHVSVWQG